jgi:hypothetical protein
VYRRLLRDPRLLRICFWTGLGLSEAPRFKRPAYGDLRWRDRPQLLIDEAHGDPATVRTDEAEGGALLGWLNGSGGLLWIGQPGLPLNRRTASLPEPPEDLEVLHALSGYSGGG